MLAYAAAQAPPAADTRKWKSDAEAALGTAAFTAGWEEGTAMTWEQAVDCALKE